MSFLLDILSGLGAGEGVLVAATLGIVALYLFKGIKFGKFLGAMMGGLMMYGIAGLIILAVATGLGWFDPRPGAFFETVATGVDFILRHGDAVVEFVRGVTGA